MKEEHNELRASSVDVILASEDVPEPALGGFEVVRNGNVECYSDHKPGQVWRKDKVLQRSNVPHGLVQAQQVNLARVARRKLRVDPIGECAEHSRFADSGEPFRWPERHEFTRILVLLSSSHEKP